MSSINIILMGLLGEGPRNAYEINKDLEYRNVRSWLKVSEAAVYRNLRKLSADGYLSTHTEKDGLMPEKTVYTVTESGRAHLLAMIGDAAEKPYRLSFDFDAWVSHLHLVTTEEAQTRIRGLRDRFKSQREWIESLNLSFEAAMPPGAAALVELRLAFLSMAETWADDLAQRWGTPPAT